MGWGRAGWLEGDRREMGGRGREGWLRIGGG